MKNLSIVLNVVLWYTCVQGIRDEEWTVLKGTRGSFLNWQCTQNVTMDNYTTVVFYFKNHPISYCNKKISTCILVPKYYDDLEFTQHSGKMMMTLKWLVFETAGDYRCVNQTTGKELDKIRLKYKCLRELNILGYNITNGVSFGENISCEVKGAMEHLYHVVWEHPYDDIFENHNVHISVLFPGNYTCIVKFRDTNCIEEAKVINLPKLSKIRYLSVFVVVQMLPVTGAVLAWFYFVGVMLRGETPKPN